MSGITRRTMLAGLAATVPALLADEALAAPRRAWIDVHHHFIPPAFREFYASARTSAGAPAAAPPMTWELNADLEDMERGGTEVAVLSIFVPYDLGTPESRARLARETNEYAARLAAEHPGRFGRFASLPLPDLDATLAELAHALDVLGADGVAVYTNVGDRWLGDAYFDPLFAELNRRRAVVFVHPTTANCCRGLVAGIPDNIIEFGTDTTRAIASLVFGGATTRFPDIRFIFSHGGGTMPYLIERFLGGASAEIVPGIRTSGQPGPYVPKAPPAGALAELRRLYFDTAQCANPVALAALRAVIPASQILYGTDYFYRDAHGSSEAIRGARVFSPRELAAVSSGNARRLLPALAAERPRPRSPERP